MEKDSVDWLTAIFVVFVAGCAWVGLLSVVDGVIELMREACGWWRESRAKSARKGSP